MDTEILSLMFSMLLCPQCEQRTVKLSDRLCCKQGLSSLLVLDCKNCDFTEEFHTSKTCGRGFDINNRMVYTMRTLGHGYTGIEKFTHLMDMPKPMTLSSYETTNETDKTCKAYDVHSLLELYDGLEHDIVKQLSLDDILIFFGVHYRDSRWIVATSVVIF